MYSKQYEETKSKQENWFTYWLLWTGLGIPMLLINIGILEYSFLYRIENRNNENLGVFKKEPWNENPLSDLWKEKLSSEEQYDLLLKC